jgi:hypothetical protein
LAVVEDAAMTFHIKRHADGEFALYKNGILIGVFDTYAEAQQRIEQEQKQEQSKEAEVKP